MELTVTEKRAILKAALSFMKEECQERNLCVGCNFRDICGMMGDSAIEPQNWDFEL